MKSGMGFVSRVFEFQIEGRRQHAVLLGALAGQRLGQRSQHVGQIASAGTQEYGASMPDLLEGMVALKENQQLFDASAKVVTTSDQMLGTLLDLRV